MWEYPHKLRMILIYDFFLCYDGILFTDMDLSDCAEDSSEGFRGFKLF